VLTIAISVSAGASALIDYVPGLGSDRVGLALMLLVAVAALTWFGHIGRAVFALMTIGGSGGVFAPSLFMGAMLGSVHGHGRPSPLDHRGRRLRARRHGRRVRSRRPRADHRRPDHLRADRRLLDHPAHGNSTRDWDLTQPEHPNPEYR
jgi:hypothetical protein